MQYQDEKTFFKTFLLKIYHLTVIRLQKKLDFFCTYILNLCSYRLAKNMSFSDNGDVIC